MQIVYGIGFRRREIFPVSNERRIGWNENGEGNDRDAEIRYRKRKRLTKTRGARGETISLPASSREPFCIQHAESIDALVCLRPPHPPMLLPLSFRVWSRKTATHSSIHSFIPFHPSFLVPFPPPPFSFLFALPVLSISVFVSFDSVRVPFPVPNFPRGTFRPAKFCISWTINYIPSDLPVFLVLLRDFLEIGRHRHRAFERHRFRGVLGISRSTPASSLDSITNTRCLYLEVGGFRLIIYRFEVFWNYFEIP